MSRESALTSQKRLTRTGSLGFEQTNERSLFSQQRVRQAWRRVSGRWRRSIFGGQLALQSGDEDEGDWSLADSYRVIRSELDEHLAQRRRQHVDAARTFLPRILQRPDVSMHTGAGTVVHRCNACVVFSDASGFTKLTEALAQKADGAEVLSKCLNKFFTPLIDIIEAYRGDVIKFSGDALSILFEAVDDYQLMPAPCGSPDAVRKTPLQLACLRGVACCLEIHKRLHNFDTGEDGVRLTLHIGVGAGGVTILQVGGTYSRFEYVIAGTPMEQIAIAEPLAGSGETVLSPQCWNEVAYTMVYGAPLRDAPAGFHRIAGLDPAQHTYPTVKQAALECTRIEMSRNTPLDDKDLLKLSERFIPRAVLQKLRGSNSSSINEMRFVTIIFAQIGGVDVSTPHGSQVAQDLMLSMQKACYTHEGNLNKFLVDDKGLLFLFVFGLPPLMHIDDPTRAIVACFQMAASLQAMRLVGRFGITTGRAFCGIVGSDRRREYTVMGDTVNLSARLMAKAAENSLLIDEQTYLRVRQDVTCDKLTPIMVKGKANPIQVYTPHPPKIQGLEVPQLEAVLQCNLGWKQARPEVEVKLQGKGGRSSNIVKTFKVPLPWRGCSRAMGGPSPLLQLTRWRELQQIQQMKMGPLNMMCVGGCLHILGQSGSGKEELCEHLIMEAAAEGLVPLFGFMRNRSAERWRAVVELIQSCMRALHQHHLAEGGKDLLQDYAEDLLRRTVHKEKHLHKVVAALGFEGFEVPGERAPLKTEAPDETAEADFEAGTAEIATRLVLAVAKRQGIMVMLRLKRGTDLHDGLGDKNSAFWELATRLSELGQERQQDIITGRGADTNPILVVIVARERPKRYQEVLRPPEPPVSPSAAGGANWGTTSESAMNLRLLSRELVMSPLTQDAAVELMCHCLNLPTTHGGSLVKRKLREFVSAVSINVPRYIQECMEHLTLESALEVKDGECQIIIRDLNAVPIAEWIQTSMVGGTISQLENLGMAKNHIMKLAAVFEGPFSPLDLAAANRVLFGRLPRMLSFYDQAKLLTACQELARAGFLQEVKPTVGERVPARLPRWTISNSLYRKVAGCMLLNSQRLLIKRAVLIERALNVEMPQRIAAVAQRTQAPGRLNRSHSGIMKAHMESSPETAPFQTTYTLDEPHEAHAVLVSACALGNVQMTAEALKSPHVDVNRPGEVGGYFPLHYAASSGEVDIVHLLCERKAQVDVKSQKQETPLLVAAQRGHLEVVQYLCEVRDALSVSKLDSVEYWERVLPEITSEEGISVPLWPGFGPVAMTSETSGGQRRDVLNWLTHELKVVNDERRSQGSYSNSVSLSVQILEAKHTHSSPDEALPGAVRANVPREELRGSARGSWRILMNSASLDPSHANSKRGLKAWFTMPGRAFTAAAGDLIPAKLRNAALRSRIRSILRGRVWLVVGLIALCIALYLPDIWISAGMPSSQGADNILICVMVLFSLEVLLLSAVDSSYPLSFFFFMDCVGTISMIWDISFLLGTNAASEQQSNSSNQDLTLFRATRTAKIGARAGRLSRLVKVMRFLPGMGGKQDSGVAESEKLQQISNLLTNVLSKRVACLTIALVIVMPLFTISAYPEADFSTRVWVESLGRRVQYSKEDNITGEVASFQLALRDFAEFYRNEEYGPYAVCCDDPAFFITGCHDLGDLSGFSKPERGSFRLIVRDGAGTFRAKFDYSIPSIAEAHSSLALISLVIVLMCGACLVLNYSASEQAVRPLERMLTSIKKSAEAIFTTVKSMESTEDDEDFAEDMDGEIALLERVVKKVATLAEISSKKTFFDEAALKGLKNEDLGVLALANNTAAADPNVRRVEQAVEVRKAGNEVSVTMHWQLEEIGLAYEAVDSWHFNVLDLSQKTQEQIAAWLLMNNPGSCHWTEHNVDVLKLKNFVGLVCAGYLPNPYHNFLHSVDVTHTVFRYMTLMQAELIFGMLDQFSLLVAAIGHDLGHIGLNNSFLTEVQHELAIRYNDRSPLENMHCSKLFEILTQEQARLFAAVSHDQYKEARKTVIDAILHTDIIQHPPMVKELELLYEMNSKVFEANQTTKLSPQEIEVLATPDSKKLITRTLLHSADISNPTKPWSISQDWAYRVLDEYANQGDQEKRLGIPVQMLNDREKVNRPSSQIGFIEFIITPWIVAKVKVFPCMVEASVQLEQNLLVWEKLYMEENHTEAEREKVRERVQKILASLRTRPDRKDSVPVPRNINLNRGERRRRGP